MSEDMARRMERAGFRLTAPRQAVLQVLQTEKGHLSHAEVLRLARRIYPGVSRATVYRTLDILTTMGMLRPLYDGVRGSQVARVEGGHHHLLCLECGTTIHFDDCALRELEERVGTRLGFQIRSHLLEFFGICRECNERSTLGKA